LSAADGAEARTLEELAVALEGVGFAGDWHANTPWAVRAVEYAAAQGIATLIHTGDFGSGLSGSSWTGCRRRASAGA